MFLLQLAWLILPHFVNQWKTKPKPVKPNNFELCNCQMSSFTNIQGNCTNFVNLSFSISEYFLERDYLPWIWKDSITHLNDFGVCLKWKPYYMALPLKTALYSVLFSFAPPISLLEPQPRPEGSYKIGSVRLSFRMSVSFIRIGSLVFSEI